MYAEVLLSVMPYMVKKLLERSFGVAEDVREALVLYRKELVRLIGEDELVRAIASDRSSWENLLSMNLTEYRWRGFESLRPLVETIQEVQARGELGEGDPWELVQLLGIVKILRLYKDQVSPEQYPKLVGRLAQVIADGLACPARGRE